jgi:hypothetical protein
LTPRIVDDPSGFAPVAPDGKYEVGSAAMVIRREYAASKANRVANRTERPDAHLSPPAVTFACGELLDDSEGVAEYWLSAVVVEKDGSGPLQRCDLRNALDESAVAAIIVRISSIVAEASVTTLHEKAVVIESRSEDTLYVLHQDGTTEADIELIAVRYFSE